MSSLRLFLPGVGALVGYVLVVGNPWLNRDLQLSLTDSDSALRLVNVMVFYPSWLLDMDEAGPYQFWLANLRTILFVGLAIAGLPRVLRWLRETTGAVGVVIATVGVIAVSAVAAGMTAQAVALMLLEAPFSPSSDLTTDFFLGQLGASASFGVLFGLGLGVVVVTQRHAPSIAASYANRPARSRVNVPKSFW